MHLRKCHKCGYAMLPQSRVTYNHVISSLEYRCMKCQAKVHVPENVSTGAMIALGLGCIILGDTIYAVMGVLMVVVPFWRRLRNPALSREAMAALGLAELGPADLEPVGQPAGFTQAEPPAKGDWTARAEQQLTAKPKEEVLPTGRRPHKPQMARPSGFGRRAAR